MLRSISRVNTPPSVSMPSDSGVTSSSSTSLTSPCSTPACTAAPIATTSSGLTPLCGSLPKNCFTTSCTFGMRVMPPTRTTSSISAGREARVLERLAARLDGLLDQVVDQRLELRARQLQGQMLRTGRVGRDERQVDLGLRRGRELDLRLLGGFLQALQRELVAAQVDALLLLELVGEVVRRAACRSLRRRGTCRRWSTSPRTRRRRSRGSRCRTCRRRGHRPRWCRSCFLSRP